MYSGVLEFSLVWSSELDKGGVGVPAKVGLARHIDEWWRTGPHGAKKQTR